jgi:hypothetical protein
MCLLLQKLILRLSIKCVSTLKNGMLRKKSQEQYEEGHPYGPKPIEVEEVDIFITGSGTIAPARHVVPGTRKRVAATPSVGKYFKPRTNHGDQPTIKSVLQGE